MLRFENDYSEGAHEAVLRRLTETNLESQPGYGADDYSAAAAAKIRAVCACPEANIYFLIGGTQANQVVIDSCLAPYEGVLAAETGHISTHEAGAIEFTGHKVLTLPQREGKLSAADVEGYVRKFYADENHEHMVFPGMVYITHPTEYGTLYTKEELAAISQMCRRYEIPLYLDGARLGYALAARDTDVTLADIAAYCDVFYIGGTKVGALCGEAVVFTRNTPAHFVNSLKRHGALLAKGRLVGLQFDALFTDGLYLKIGKHAIEMADRLRQAFAAKGYAFGVDSPTNQIFIVLENAQMEKLREKVTFSFWESVDESHTVVRFATSWATRPEDIDALIAIL